MIDKRFTLFFQRTDHLIQLHLRKLLHRVYGHHGIIGGFGKLDVIHKISPNGILRQLDTFIRYLKHQLGGRGNLAVGALSMKAQATENRALTAESQNIHQCGVGTIHADISMSTVNLPRLDYF